MNEPKKRGRPRLLDPKESPAQEYARRVWDGQSVDLPIKERTKRVMKALEEQGFSTDGIVLP